jgi:hypothetical protein
MKKVCIFASHVLFFSFSSDDALEWQKKRVCMPHVYATSSILFPQNTTSKTRNAHEKHMYKCKYILIHLIIVLFCVRLIFLHLVVLSAILCVMASCASFIRHLICKENQRSHPASSNAPRQFVPQLRATTFFFNYNSRQGHTVLGIATWRVGPRKESVGRSREIPSTTVQLCTV